MRWVTNLFGSSLLVTLTACGAQTMELRRIEEGQILTRGVTIRAADGSFQYVSGTPFPASWTAENCPVEPTTSNWSLAPGAKAVLVSTPHSPRELHGILAFCPTPNRRDQPSGRSYGIEVSAEVVSNTSGGRVAFATEDLNHSWTYVSRAGTTETRERWPTWILWVSERALR